MKGILFSVLIVGIFPSFASAYVVGPSNLTLGQYDEFSKIKPTEPYDRNRNSYDMYRSDVEDYVRAAKEYVGACDNDIERIREAQQEAIDNANRVIRDFNDWVNRP